MDVTELLTFLDRFGVLVFAFSGGLAAAKRDMDFLGVCVVALLPAVGGGTLRDVLLNVPVFWLEDTASLGLALAGGVAAFFLAHLHRLPRAMLWADALGLSVFATLGAAKTSELGFAYPIVIAMGTITATAGGLTRDVVCNEQPLLLSEDVYATAAIAGAGAFCLSHWLSASPALCLLAGLGVAFALRAAAIVYELNLPRARR